MDDRRARGGDGRPADALRSARAPRPADDAAVEELASGAAWERYCDALREAGRHVLASSPPAARAAGAEYLLGLVRAGLGLAFELADPADPRFFRNPDSTSRWGAENADNQYLWARVDPAHTYRIRGERGTAFDFLVEVKEGYMQLGDERNFATLRAGDVGVDANGRFEISLSAAAQPGTWLPLHPDARYVAIRQFLCDWESETPARFFIERTDDRAPAPRAEPARVAARLFDAGEWTLETARFFGAWTDALREDWRPDALPPARKYAGGAEDIYYGNAYYRLGEGEALVVETVVPDADYWQFQLCDLQFRSDDWPERQTSLNAAQAVLDADGRFRCVVSPEEPGVPNWLDTGGAREGVLQYRFVWSRTCPQPSARAVPIADVRAALPADTPSVTAAARRRSLAARRRHRALREPAS